MGKGATREAGKYLFRSKDTACTRLDCCRHQHKLCLHNPIPQRWGSSEIHTYKTTTIDTGLEMHHSHTHTTRNNNANHIQHNSPALTKHYTPTHKQQSIKGQNNVLLQININGIRNKIEELKTLYTSPNQTSTQYKKQNSHRKLKQTGNTNKEGAHHTHQGRHNFHKHKHTQGHQHTHHRTTTGCCCCRPTPSACSCGWVRQPSFSREALPGVSST